MSSASETAGPLRMVLAELERGGTSLASVSFHTGLSRDLVDLAVDRLVALGRLDAEVLITSCPAGGCGACASATQGSPGCGAAGASGPRSGTPPSGTLPVMVRLRRRSAMSPD